MKAIECALVLLASALAVCAEDDWEKAQQQYDQIVRIASRYPVREFEKAVESGDVTAVKRLLDEGVPVSLQIPTPQDEWEGIPPSEQAIHIATARGHLEVVRLLVNRGAASDARDTSGLTPLHRASNPEIAKLLLAHGAQASAKSDDGWQPIHSAAAESLDLVKLLIKHGADPLAKDQVQTQPIHFAADRGMAETGAFFLEHNAKVGAAIRSKEDYFRNGWQPLHFAASRDDSGESIKIAELLIRKGADVDAITAEGETPLLLSKNSAMTRLLLDHGAKASVMSTGIVKRQPIHHFAMEGDVESLKLLLDHGAELEATTGNDEKETPLDIAAFWSKNEAVEFLLKRGAKATAHTLAQARRSNDQAVIRLVYGRLHPRSLRPAHHR